MASAKRQGIEVTKFFTIMLLISICLTFTGIIHILAPDTVQDVDVGDCSFSILNRVVDPLCEGAILFILRCIAQVQISLQILLSFFFYSWRNTIYKRIARRFSFLFPSLETVLDF